MKLIQFYQKAFASLKGHWGVVLLTIGVNFLFTRILAQFGMAYFNLSILPTKYAAGNATNSLTMALCIIGMAVCYPLFYRLPLLLSFGRISWRAD